MPKYTRLASDCNPSRLKWVFDKELGTDVAILDGTFATFVKPDKFLGRTDAETWAFWFKPEIGHSGSWYHRFLVIRVGSTFADGAVWMDFFGQ